MDHQPLHPAWALIFIFVLWGIAGALDQDMDEHASLNPCPADGNVPSGCVFAGCPDRQARSTTGCIDFHRTAEPQVHRIDSSVCPRVHDADPLGIALRARPLDGGQP